MLVIIAIIAILLALLLPVLSAGKERAKRTVCSNNLGQINLGVHLYSDDSNDRSPAAGKDTVHPLTNYRTIIQGFIGQNGQPSPDDKLFACPSDTFHYHVENGQATFVSKSMHAESSTYYSSYAFNGVNEWTNLVARLTNRPLPGIAGRALSSIRHPTKTVLVAEDPAFLPFSWHKPKQPITDPANRAFNNAMDMISFVDGHVAYIKMFWNGHWLSTTYDPPGEYDYQWSGE